MHENDQLLAEPSHHISPHAVLPTFLGIGVQRGATTWAYKCLCEHPDVFMPETKELGYFRWRYENGLNWYASHFEGRRHESAAGEITPGYLHSPEAIRRIAADLPKVRLFVILREPIQRAYSAYQLLRDQYQGQSFAEVCGRSGHLVRESLYAESLAEVYTFFDRSQVKVFLYDDVKRDPGGVLRELFTFLGVDPSFRPASSGEFVNQRSIDPLLRTLRSLKLGWAVDQLSRTSLGNVIKKAIHRHRGGQSRSAVIDCPDEIKAKFLADLDNLECFIDRDLSHWKRLSSPTTAPVSPVP